MGYEYVVTEIVAADALALAGVDYLVVGPKVLATLSETPTLQGYNDGLTTLPGDDEYYSPRLSPEAAKEADFEDFELEPVTKQVLSLLGLPSELSPEKQS